MLITTILLGMVVMDHACNMAIAKAKEHGFGLVATHHTSSGTGAIGYFGSKIAEENLLGFVFSQSPEVSKDRFIYTHGDDDDDDDTTTYVALITYSLLRLLDPMSQFLGPILSQLAFPPW